MTTQQALLSLWPYYVLSIALIISWIAIGRIRRKERKQIDQLEGWYKSLHTLHETNTDRMHLLQEILLRTQPGYRLIKNDPSKLEAWLQTLKKPKGKKKIAKNKKA